MKIAKVIALLGSLLTVLPASAAQTYFNQLNDGEYQVGWQDHEGKPLTLTYRLEKGSIPPLVAFRPARMKEDVVQALLTSARQAHPNVQFLLSRPSLDVQLKSRQAEQAQKAMAWLVSERKKEEAAWLQSHYFHYFTPPDGQLAIKQDHVRIALESRAELAPLASQLKQEGAHETETRQKTVAHMLTFVQSIPYLTLDSLGGRLGKGFLTPRQVLAQNRGDCDSKVTLMAAMLAQLFPTLKQAIVIVPGHALLGVALPAQPGEATLAHGGERYVLLEPTGPALLPVGQIAPASKMLIDSQQVSTEAVNVPKG
ncbi:hypothetical protein [Aeromonas cavernicola]|uniref:Transglutaminase domain-containing protein n=1 Tax=Aeromonas cavernicola TaxID=1006623 RepID=A0A2H9U546_9GAMM|nr:hypothetical protein [Aeromonas cavernicola]PJG59109.1 hypothetical protein CUC53_08980 [Aeromonas cavernicola]